jgi:hypothetical protein
VVILPNLGRLQLVLGKKGGVKCPFGESFQVLASHFKVWIGPSQVSESFQVLDRSFSSFGVNSSNLIDFLKSWSHFSRLVDNIALSVRHFEF